MQFHPSSIDFVLTARAHRKAKEKAGYSSHLRFGNMIVALAYDVHFERVDYRGIHRCLSQLLLGLEIRDTFFGVPLAFMAHRPFSADNDYEQSLCTMFADSLILTSYSYAPYAHGEWYSNFLDGFEWCCGWKYRGLIGDPNFPPDQWHTDFTVTLPVDTLNLQLLNAT